MSLSISFVGKQFSNEGMIFACLHSIEKLLVGRSQNHSCISIHLSPKGPRPYKGMHAFADVFRLTVQIKIGWQETKSFHGDKRGAKFFFKIAKRIEFCFPCIKHAFVSKLISSSKDHCEYCIKKELHICFDHCKNLCYTICAKFFPKKDKVLYLKIFIVKKGFIPRFFKIYANVQLLAAKRLY